MKNVRSKTKSASGGTTKPKSPRTNLYIDGTNLLAGLVELLGLEEIPKFSSTLKIVRQYYSFQKIFFYASYTTITEKSKPREKAYAAKEFQFLREVKKTPNLIFYKGYRSPTSKKEKGVDVHLAVDLVKDAFLNKYDRAIIMSGDADLVYTVSVAKLSGKEIVAASIASRFSRGIAYEVKSGIILNYKNAPRNNFGKLPKTVRIISIKNPRM